LVFYSKKGIVGGHSSIEKKKSVFVNEIIPKGRNVGWADLYGVLE